jgi:hypothetical protein
MDTMDIMDIMDIMDGTWFRARGGAPMDMDGQQRAALRRWLPWTGARKTTGKHPTNHLPLFLPPPLPALTLFGLRCYKFWVLFTSHGE